MRNLYQGGFGLRECLQRHGVNILTGEAEGVWGLQRWLCDLNTEGRRLWASFLGGQVAFAEGGGWNPEVNGLPSVASIMAAPETLWTFVYFAEAEAGFTVYLGEGIGEAKGRREAYAFENTEEAEEAFAQAPYLRTEYDWRRIHTEGTAGTRNTHEMSGRVC